MVTRVVGGRSTTNPSFERAWDTIVRCCSVVLVFIIVGRVALVGLPSWQRLQVSCGLDPSGHSATPFSLLSLRP